MQLTTKAIVLSSIKYGDTGLIVKAYTASDGLKSYLLKGVLGSKKGKLKPAYFQPLMQLEIVATHRNKGTLERIREVRVGHPYQTIHTNIIKNGMALFLAEILTSCIQEEEKDEGLYNYLEYAFLWLDNHSEVANFHLGFLLNLSKFLGFPPDTSSTDLPYFDLLEGSFIATPSLNPMLSDKNLTLFKKLLGINFDTLNFVKMDRGNRHELLQSIILYFELHLQGFRKPKSLHILNAVFQ